MTEESLEIRLAPLEEERFGIRTARASWLDRRNLSEANAFCRKNDVRLLIGNVRADDREAIAAVQRDGCVILDTIARWEQDLVKNPPAEPPRKVQTRPVRKDEAGLVQDIASQSYRGYVSHYHADDRLDPERSAEVHPDWARRLSLDESGNARVLVAEHEGRIVGFFGMEMIGEKECSSPLSGVLRDARGLGAEHVMAVDGLRWGIERGATRFVAMMQITNAGVLKAAIRTGCVPVSAFHIVHKWFD